MPAKLPTQIKELRGTYRPDRENLAEPRGVPASTLRPSKALAVPVKREFARILKLLVPLNVVCESDIDELEALAIVRCEIRLLQNRLFESTGDIKVYRKVQNCLHDALKIASVISSKFGLNPVDRSRVSVLSKPNNEARPRVPVLDLESLRPKPK